MDIEEDAEIPLILGYPFMLTANCVVDMGKGNLEMSVDDQKVTFNLFAAMKHYWISPIVTFWSNFFFIQICSREIWFVGKRTGSSSI